MFTLARENAVDYLRSKGWVPADEVLQVEELSVAQSSTVMRVTSPVRRWVVKQALPKMKSDPEWEASVERSLREVACQKYLETLLPLGSVPPIYHHDPDNFLFVMEGAPADCQLWHDAMMEGKTDAEVAASAGSLLGNIHRLSYLDEEALHEFGDKHFFHELQLSPFYDSVAKVYPKLADKIGAHAALLATSNVCFIHGDFTARNIVVAPHRLILLDFEAGHFGHPSFDLALMVCHLTLKTVRFREKKEDFMPLIITFWTAYLQSANFENETWHARACLPQLGCILLSRVDGKSPIDYLPDEQDRQRMRALSASLISREIPSVMVFLDILSRAL